MKRLLKNKPLIFSLFWVLVTLFHWESILGYSDLVKTFISESNSRLASNILYPIWLISFLYPLTLVYFVGLICIPEQMFKKAFENTAFRNTSYWQVVYHILIGLRALFGLSFAMILLEFAHLKEPQLNIIYKEASIPNFVNYMVQLGVSSKVFLSTCAILPLTVSQAVYATISILIYSVSKSPLISTAIVFVPLSHAYLLQGKPKL